MINVLLGKANETDMEISAHRRSKPISNQRGRLGVEFNYNDQTEHFTVASLLGMFLAKQVKRIESLYGKDVRLAFAMPPSFSVSTARVIKEACSIAQVDTSKLFFADSSDCLIATYKKKLQGLRGPEIQALEVI
jgi:hypothetical protein